MCDEWSPATLTSDDWAAGCDSRLTEKTINQEKIHQSAAKHMTGQAHGRGSDGRKQRQDRRAEMIRVTHLLTWRERASRHLYSRKPCERFDVRRRNSLGLDLIISQVRHVKGFVSTICDTCLFLAQGPHVPACSVSHWKLGSMFACWSVSF